MCTDAGLTFTKAQYSAGMGKMHQVSQTDGDRKSPQKNNMNSVSRLAK